MCGFVKLSADQRSTHRSPWDAHKGLIMIRGQQNGDTSEIYRKQQQSENNSQEMNSEKVFWSAFMWGGGGGKASEEKTIPVEEDDDNSSRETQTTGAQVVATKLLTAHKKSRISSACQKFLFHTADEGKVTTDFVTQKNHHYASVFILCGILCLKIKECNGSSSCGCWPCGCAGVWGLKEQVRVSVTHSATQYTVEIQADISNIQSQNCGVPLKLHWVCVSTTTLDLLGKKDVLLYIGGYVFCQGISHS